VGTIHDIDQRPEWGDDRSEEHMEELTIELPGSITAADAKLYLAIKLFEVGRLSCGQAAALAGYSKRTFMELLGKHGVAVFDYPAQLADDLSHA
jgi:predicted HTH domain antitoxin